MNARHEEHCAKDDPDNLFHGPSFYLSVNPPPDIYQLETTFRADNRRERKSSDSQAAALPGAAFYL
jgi:hypothetical protein